MSAGPLRWLAGGVTLVALLPIVPRAVGAQEADGFDGYVQSGMCAAPTDDLRVKLDSDGDHDIEPYLARTGTGDDTVVLGYYGSPGLPGFAFSAIYTDQPFSLVITAADDGEPVACGDLLRPDRDRYGEAGFAVVQLLPVADSTVQGFALVERGRLQRELDVTPTRVRVLLSTGGDVVTSAPDYGYDGFIQDGTCESPGDRLRVSLKSQDDVDVGPFLARPTGAGEPVTVAYHGSSYAPGFGLASAYSDEVFALVLTDSESGDPAACGDILEPDDEDFAEAGLALVQLSPTGDPGAQGFALIERIALQRETDVTPTRVAVLLFAPPVPAS